MHKHLFSGLPAQHRTTEDWLITPTEFKDGPEKNVCDLFATVTEALSSIPNGAEKQAGMRKLMEARECFLRSVAR